MGTFRTLDACVADARDNGFREVLDERRMVPRCEVSTGCSWIV
jgi:hypothetical protein